jgi:hypothetical protein
MRRTLFVTLLAAAVVLSGCEGPHVWDYQVFMPKEADLIGTYKVVRYHRVDAIEGLSKKDPIQIVLNTDHTVEFSDFPEFDGFGDFVICKLSGPGIWALTRGLPTPEIQFELKAVPKSAVPESPYVRRCYGNFSLPLVGHLNPYRLYVSIGDPDDDMGIEFERVTR